MQRQEQIGVIVSHVAAVILITMGTFSCAREESHLPTLNIESVSASTAQSSSPSIDKVSNRSTAVGWRTDGTGRYPTASPPTQWSETDNVLWAAELGNWSNATPVVVGDRVFVCREPFDLVCVSTNDGSVLWQRSNSIQDAMPKVSERPDDPNTHGYNGYSTPTPVSNGKFVWTLHGNGVAACYDMNGQRQWIRFVQSPQAGWGQSSSPVLVDNTLIVEIIDVFGLDASTGKNQWQHNLGEKHSFGSPVAMNIDGTDILITPTGDFLRVADGFVYARRKAHLEYNAPIVHDRTVYFITGDSQAFHLSLKTDGTLEVELKWRGKLSGDRYYSSPVYHEGLIYAITRGQQLSVIDADDGQRLYDRKLSLSDTGGNNAVYSSPTVAGNHVYLTGLDGTTVVLNPGRVYDETERNNLPETRANPVFIADRLYIRAAKKLFCVTQGTL